MVAVIPIVIAALVGTVCLSQLSALVTGLEYGAALRYAVMAEPQAAVTRHCGQSGPIGSCWWILSWNHGTDTEDVCTDPRPRRFHPHRYYHLSGQCVLQLGRHRVRLPLLEGDVFR